MRERAHAFAYILRIRIHDALLLYTQKPIFIGDGEGGGEG